jgi:hypothetical protein
MNYDKIATSISDEELLEMASVSPKKTGIDDVYLWFGPNPHYPGHRIKVSNVPNKFSRDDCFTINIPDLQVIGNVNTDLISKGLLENIKNFIKLNKKIICEFSEARISTDEFIEGLVKLNV